MGTDDFSASFLLSLLKETKHKITAVFTQASKAKGRSLKVLKSAVHEIADEFGIRAYTPLKLKNDDTYSLIDSIPADVIIVCSYGLIIPPRILKAKKYGCLNIHPSLLPKYRGAAPLQRTIINGEKSTAVCIMQMDEGLDTGDIILMEEFDLSDRATTQDLKIKAHDLGMRLLLKTLDEIETLPRTSQSYLIEKGINPSYAHKLQKEEAKIDWNQTAQQIDCNVRAMQPWPGTYFSYNDSNIKVLSSKVETAEDIGLDKKAFKQGVIVKVDKYLYVACSENILRIDQIQKPGGKPMKTEDFLRGYRLELNTRLS